jgi:uncharacterized protein (DUF1919 family)
MKLTIINKLIRFSDRKRLKNQTFTVISNDCWGGEVYHYFNLAYNTPFIGLYIMAPCYIKLLKNFEHYMSQEMQFVSHSKYSELNLKRKSKPHPIGKLGDIEIQFLHYSDEIDAREKWNRRKERMDRNNIHVKFDGSKDGSTLELITEFDALPIKNKICLSNTKYENIKSLVYCPQWDRDGVKLFWLSKKRFSLVKWLNAK